MTNRITPAAAEVRVSITVPAPTPIPPMRGKPSPMVGVVDGLIF